MSTSAATNVRSVVARGVFTAGGSDIPLTSSTDTFKFPGEHSPDGTFRVRHKVTHSHSTFDPSTCLFSESQQGRYWLSNGTDDFAGIVGSGHFTVTAFEVAARTSTGKCAQNKPPTAFQFLVQASGPVSLPHHS
jgi:hypothetical protein